jgi:uncharacterized protein YehS (DUF1456 family)
MQFMPTNDVFHHIIRLLQIHKDKDLIIEIFKSAGVEVSKSKLKAWDTKTGRPVPGYREMPKEDLQAFIDELYQRKLVECDDDA